MAILSIVPVKHEKEGFGFVVTEEYFLNVEQALDLFSKFKEGENDNN